MTGIVKRMHLSLRISASKQRSVSRAYRRIVVRFNDQHLTQPLLQVIRGELRLLRTVQQASVLMYKDFFQKLRGNCFIKVSAPELRFRVPGSTERRKKHLVEPKPQYGNKQASRQ